MKTLRLESADFDKNYKSHEEYESLTKERQTALLHLQRALFHHKKRVIFAFEGWDAAGKGGAIRRLTELLDPRGVRVHSISAPSPEEQGKHYLYRFWEKLPPQGHIAVFDRTWYGRVLVERIEGFCTQKEWQRAYDEINEFERTLTDDDVIMVKFFLHITKDEQKERFLDRLNDPLKHWKMTPEDLRNREKWDDYAKAINDMLAKTNTEHAPWHLIAANNKHYTRAKTLKISCETLEKRIDAESPFADANWVAAAIKALNDEKN
jgi:PPK2 family polyphosphate:nucleotide phosphotransferase